MLRIWALVGNEQKDKKHHNFCFLDGGETSNLKEVGQNNLLRSQDRIIMRDYSMLLTYFLLIWGSLGYSILPPFSAAEGSLGDPAPLGEEAAFGRAGVLRDRDEF